MAWRSLTTLYTADGQLAGMIPSSDHWTPGVTTSADYSNYIGFFRYYVAVRGDMDAYSFIQDCKQQGLGFYPYIILPNGYRLVYTITGSASFPNYGWRFEDVNGDQVFGTSGGANPRHNPDGDYALIGFEVNDEEQKARFLMALYNGSTNFITEEAHVDERYEIAMYQWLTGGLEPTYNYKPIAYFEGNNRHMNLAMLHDPFTNHGVPEIAGSPYELKTYQNIIQVDDLVANMTLYSEKIIAYTKNSNWMSFVFDSTDGTVNTYAVKYYVDNELVGSLTHYFTRNPSQGETLQGRYYMQYYIDTDNELVRPAWILVFPDASGNPVRIQYNTEVVSKSQQEQWFAWYHTDDPPLDPPDDPFYFGGDTEPTVDPDGEFDFPQDDVEEPDIPDISLTDAGFMNLYKPSWSQIKQLAQYMWGSSFIESSWKKLFSNPMECIMGLGIVPFVVSSGSPEHVFLGNMDSGISMAPVSNTTVKIDCGSVTIRPQYGAYLDWDPYTKVSLFLPYIGTVHLNADDIQGFSVSQATTVNITYHVDVVSGACVAFVKITSPEVKLNSRQVYHAKNNAVFYTYTGNCRVDVPVSQADYRGMLGAVLGVATSAGLGAAAIATGGMTAPLAMGLASSTVANVMNAKPDVSHGGSVSGMAGFLGPQKPFLIFSRPAQCKADDQEAYSGYPSHISYTLQELVGKGFTKVEEIHLEGINATSAEIDEIYSLLKEGVIL